MNMHCIIPGCCHCKSRFLCLLHVDSHKLCNQNWRCISRIHSSIRDLIYDRRTSKKALAPGQTTMRIVLGVCHRLEMLGTLFLASALSHSLLRYKVIVQVPCRIQGLLIVHSPHLSSDINGQLHSRLFLPAPEPSLPIKYQSLSCFHGPLRFPSELSRQRATDIQ